MVLLTQTSFFGQCASSGKWKSKLAESVFSSIKICSGVTFNKHKQFLISCKMTVSFKLNNFDFSPLFFPTASKPVSSDPASLSFATAFRSSNYVSAQFLSDPIKVCDDTVCSSDVYLSKPLRPSKPVCLSNIRPSKPITSSNLYLSKPICPRNISFSRSIRSSDVC